MKLISITVTLFVLLLTSSFLQASADYIPPICNGKCNVRCSKAGFKDRCMKYCLICCAKCNTCVPSGTYGNKDECPCYRDMKNSKDESKCP